MFDIKSISWRKQILVFILVAIVSVASTCLIWWNVESDIEDLNTTWMQFSDVEVAKSEAMAKVVVNFGYGGFIHHFKNLILRSEYRYRDLSEQSLAETKKAVAEYLDLDISDIDRQHMRQFQATLDEYTAKFELAKTLTNQNLTVKEIDDLVKVDDELAIAALDQLLNSISVTASQTQLNTKEQIERSHQSLHTGFVVILMVLIMAIILISYGFILLMAQIREKLLMFELAPHAILISNEQGVIIDLNERARSLFHIPKDLKRSVNIDELVPKEYRGAHAANRQKFMQKNHSREMSQRPNLHALKMTGERFPVEIAISAYQTTSGRESIAIVRDLSDISELKKEAQTDVLTGALNRSAGTKALEKALATATRYNTGLSILMMDIDFFKRVNDTFGHLRGDEVLKEVSDLVATHIRTSDVLSRWGGEEFLVIAPNIRENEALAMAEVVRQRIETAFQQQKPTVTISIGVAECKPNDTIDSILVRADSALYDSKHNGRNQVSVGK